MTTSVDTIISVEWLKNNLNDPTSNICLLDASWHLPSFGRDAIQEFKVIIRFDYVFIKIIFIYTILNINP